MIYMYILFCGILFDTYILCKKTVNFTYKLHMIIIHYIHKLFYLFLPKDAYATFLTIGCKL